MLAALTRFVLHQRLLVCLAGLALLLGGAAAWRLLPIDAFPDVTNVQVMILTEAPSRASLDVEQQITAPIELAMQGLPRVQQVRSLSKAGLSQVVVVFEDGADIYFARQLVFERLAGARELLPEGIEPELGPISTGLGEIYQYTVESDRRSLTELRTLHDRVVAPRLRALAGVNEVNSFGGYVRQIHVLTDPRRLLRFGIELRDVLEALARNNANAAGGFLVEGWEQTYVRSLGQAAGVADIESVVLKASDGTPVFLRDVAEVIEGACPRQGAVTRDGRGERVAGMVIMLRGENSKLVVDRVRKTIPAIQTALPPDVRVDAFYDRTSLIQACIRTVSGALAQGGVFVVAVLFLFLGNLRAAALVALSLPMTACVAFLLMGWQGTSANLMSLGGLAIALGMVVDASIVVVENIERHLAAPAAGRSRRETIFHAVREVGRPIVFSVLTIVVVFLPLFTLEQMEGKMFKPLALTLCFAMLGSLAVALTLMPVLSDLLLRIRPGARSRALELGLALYRPVLRFALRQPAAVAAVAALVFAASLALLPRVGREFLPPLDEGAIAINAVRLPSASLEGSVAVGTAIEKRLAQFPEVSAVVTKTGRAEISEDPMGPEQSDFVIMLRPEREWKTGRDKAALVEAIRQDLAAVPGLRLSFSQPIALRVNELISGVKSDLAVKFFGEDLDALKSAADRAAALVGGVRGAVDVKVEQVSGLPQIEVVINRRAIARHHLNVDDVNELIETAIGGRTATWVAEGSARTAVVVRYPPAWRQDLAALRRLQVRSPDGALVPLEELAEFRQVEAPAQIGRERGMRRVVVECNVRGRDIGGFVREVRERLAPVAATLGTGSFVEYGGQFENQERAARRLALVVPAALALIALMLFSALKSLRAALLVMANLPFALAGGVAAIWAFGLPLSVPAAVGFIALFGTAVQNGTLLVSFLGELRASGLPLREAVEQGCLLRLRPLLMTALTTLLGLLPMLYARGSGAEIQRPLATVVIGGMLSSLVLTLLVLPALYLLVERRAAPAQTA